MKARSVIHLSFLLLSFFLQQVASAQFPEWSSFKAKYGTISFNYPSGWEVGEAPSGNRKRFTENYMMQPRGQNFNAEDGQVVIRVFDPVYVMENAGTLTAAFSQQLFNKFVSQMCEVENPRTVSKSTGGSNYFEYIQSNSGYKTKVVGARSTGGNLYVVMMAGSPGISSANDHILYQVAASIKGAEPQTHLTPQESVLAKWYSLLSSGSVEKMDNISCQSAVATGGMVDLFAELAGIPVNRSDVMKMSGAFDFSRLSYYTVTGNDELKVVRVCGSIIDPNNKVVPFYQSANRMGQSNLFIIRKEQGSWKVCESFSR